LQRALDEPPEPAALPPVLGELGAAEAVVGADGAIGHLRAAHERQVDPLDRARTAGILARALADDGQAAEAATVIEVTIAEAGEMDPDLSIGLLGDYLVSTVLQPGLRQLVVARVDPLLRALPTGSLAARRPLHAALALRSAQQPAPVSETLELAERAWHDGALLDDGPDGRAWMMVVWALLLAEEHRRVETILGAVIEAARSAGSVTAFAAASYYRGFSLLRRGQLVGAQADVEQAMAAGGGGRSPYAPIAGTVGGVILLERGDPDAAEAALSAAAQREQQWMPAEAFRLHAQGRVALARQRPVDALQLFLDAGNWLTDKLGAEHTVVPWRLDAARAALALGDPAQARTLVEPLAELAARVGLRIAAANTLGILGLAEGGDHGIELLQRSAAQLADTPAGLDHAYALVELGAALRRAGRRIDARQVLVEALHAGRRLGASLLVGRAQEELTAAGAKPRRVAITGVASLTPSEQRVSRLAAQRHTNAQIAQALFVTPKTIEYHLRHVYQKLDISGRRELETLLSQHVG
jgi:DNA-binding CsgD family transcriptional regulator